MIISATAKSSVPSPLLSLSFTNDEKWREKLNFGNARLTSFLSFKPQSDTHEQNTK